MKVYTKKGDDGKTALLGGKRVAKHDVQIESYGTVDELNSWCGVLRELSENVDTSKLLEHIQIELFNIGSHLAADPEKKQVWLPELDAKPTEELETAIDRMEDILPPMKNFILPGGTPLSRNAHIARCVCRRAERIVTALQSTGTSFHEAIIPYLNRLSDYLFVLARFDCHQNGVSETPWKPRE